MFEDLKLVPADDPILREVMPPFNFQQTIVDPVELAKAMVKVMVDNDGMGLSANQLGLRYRVFVMRGVPNIACFNPVIVDTSAEQVEMEEGCLSTPGVYINNTRPKHIKVRYTWPNGEVQTEKYTGMTARVFQHEYFHVMGEKFTDGLSRLQLETLIKKLNKSTESPNKFSLKMFL